MDSPAGATFSSHRCNAKRRGERGFGNADAASAASWFWGAIAPSSVQNNPSPRCVSVGGEQSGAICRLQGSSVCTHKPTSPGAAPEIPPRRRSIGAGTHEEGATASSTGHCTPLTRVAPPGTSRDARAVCGGRGHEPQKEASLFGAGRLRGERFPGSPPAPTHSPQPRGPPRTPQSAPRRLRGPRGARRRRTAPWEL